MKGTVSFNMFKNVHVSIHDKSWKGLTFLEVVAFMQRCRKPPQTQKNTLNIIMPWITENKQKYLQFYRDSGFCGM